MGSLPQGDLVSSPNMAESETTPDFRGTRPVLEGGVSLEIKYVKSCRNIMAGLIQLAQGEVHLHTHQCAQYSYTYILFMCTQTLTHSSTHA